MLTAKQIDALRDKAEKLADPIQAYLLREIVERVAHAGQLTSTSAYQVWKVQQLGISQRQIKQELRRWLKLSLKEIRRIMYQSAQSGYNLDVSRFPTVEAVPFEQNTVLQQIVSAAADLAGNDFTNLTQTLGMVDPYGNALPLQDAYRACTDFAFQLVNTGAADYMTAIRQATKNLADKGLRVIDYESGVHTSLEAAVRRNIMGGLGLMQEKIIQETHDQLGCDGWEITAHANSAPDHEPIQGRQYSDAEYTALNNSLRRRIGTLNCGHAAFPIILGVNKPQYTAEELEKFRQDNKKGVTIDGVHYTGYDATQMQRKLERAIRKQKNRIMVDEAAGDSEKLQQDKIKLRILHQRYREFSKAAELRTQYERTEVAGFGEKRSNTLANSAKSGILGDTGQNGIPITEEAIQRVPLVRPEGWTEEQAVKLQEAHRELLRSVMDKPVGIEAGAAYSNNMESLEYRSGSKEHHRISMPCFSEPYILIHNHPSGLAFSLEDLESFGKNFTMNVFTAVGNNGIVYLLQKLDQYNAAGFSKALFLETQILKKLEETLKSHIAARDLSVIDAAQKYAEEVMRFLKEAEIYGVSFIT